MTAPSPSIIPAAMRTIDQAGRALVNGIGRGRLKTKALRKMARPFRRLNEAQSLKNRNLG